MRRFALGAACGAIYVGAMSLLAAAGLSPGMLLPALVYAALGWWAASGAPDKKQAIHRAAVAGLGCTLGAWLISAIVVAPRFFEMTAAQAAGVLLAAFLSEVKFVALAALVGRRQVRPTPLTPSVRQQTGSGPG